MQFALDEKENQKFVSLFNQHENNIDYMLYLRDMVWNNPGIKPYKFKGKSKYEKRSSFIDELLKNRPTDNEFINKNVRWDTNLIDIDEFNNNHYLKALNNLTFESGDWSLKQKTLKAYSLFPYEEEYHYGGNSILKMSLGFFDSDYSYPTISLCDNEWMSLNPFEIRTMQIPIQIARGKVLTLGLGLGYFAYMVHLKEDVKEVHIVEMDLDLINNFNKYLLPLFPHPEKIHIHKADAFYFIKDIKDKDYDFIFSDLWHDASDGLPMYIKLKKHFDTFKATKRMYWIEGSIVTYLRTLVIGLMKDEYYHCENEYDEIQLTIKNSLKNLVLHSSYELDALLSIQGIKSSLFIK